MPQRWCLAFTNILGDLLIFNTYGLLIANIVFEDSLEYGIQIVFQRNVDLISVNLEGS